MIYTKAIYIANVKTRKNILVIRYYRSKKQVVKQHATFSNDVILFLSSIYKWINEIIKNDIKRSEAIQWVGNIGLAKELGLTINSPFIARKRIMK